MLSLIYPSSFPSSISLCLTKSDSGWRLVSAALKGEKYSVPDVKTPKVPKKDLDFLDYEQLKVFLKAIEGDPVECAALLALHSLRSSELHDLTTGCIKDNILCIYGPRGHRKS